MSLHSRWIGSVYRALFNLVLRRLDPEVAHLWAKRGLRILRMTPPGRALLARLTAPPDSSLKVRALGRTFSSPLGVAAGVDKDGTWFADLIALGFGCVEVGTVTALPQPGNPVPRIVRVLGERALINWMGFPNPGASEVAPRLAARSADQVVGVNVGKSRVVGIDEAGSDYRESIRVVAPVADYLAVNVSSPNTPGLRQLQSPERLRELIVQIRAELSELGRRVPLLVKIAPDLSDDDVDAIAGLALELDLDGIVAVNTTATEVGHPRGGLSGPPLAPRALEVLHRLRAAVGDRLTLISVGGIESADDVWVRLRAGATLVQAYTGFVHGGPGWPGRINRELARRVKRSGYASIQEIVGAAATAPDGWARLTS